MKRVRAFFAHFVMIGGFGATPVLVSVATLASVPILFEQIGSSAWVSIATGQAAGELARITVIWGWNSIGVTRVARLEIAGRISFYRNSFAPRLGLLIVCVGVLSGIATVYPTADATAFFLTAAAGAATGLSSNWMFIASGDPMGQLPRDGIPRALAIAIGAVGVVFFPQPWIFGACVLVGSAVAALLSYAYFNRVHRRSRIEFIPQSDKGRSSVISLREGTSAFLIGITSGLRMSLMLLLAPLSPTQTASEILAMSDKLLRWSNTGMSPVSQHLQADLARSRDSVRTGVFRGLRIVWSLAPVALIGVALIAPWLGRTLSLGVIQLSPTQSILLGSIVAFMFINMVVGNGLLVLLERTRAVAVISATGLCLMTLLLVVLAPRFGATGALAAFATAEAVVLAAQHLVLHSRFRLRQ